MDLTNSHICERCLEKDESANEAIAYLRIRHLGHYLTEPGNYHDAPTRNVLGLIRSIGLAEDKQE
jgi:hypothetical protein